MAGPGQDEDFIGALPLPIERRLPDGSDPWRCTPQLGRLLARLVLAGRRTVLEFGAGASSCILAAALAFSGGGTLVSLEQDPAWCEMEWADVEGQAGVKSHLLHLRVQPRHFRPAKLSTDLAALQSHRFDLVLVDAPQYWFGRDATLPFAAPYLAPTALVVLDDAGRAGEQRAIRGWLLRYPNLSVRLSDPDYGGRGVAVLRWQPGERFSLRARVLEAYAALKRGHREGHLAFLRDSTPGRCLNGLRQRPSLNL